MRYSKSAHTRFYHRFHVVWATKYRYKVLQGPMRERIREIIMQTCAEMGVRCDWGLLRLSAGSYVSGGSLHASGPLCAILNKKQIKVHALSAQGHLWQVISNLRL